MVVFRRHLPTDTSIVSMHVALNRVWDAIEAVGPVSPTKAVALLGASPVTTLQGSAGGGGSSPAPTDHNSLSGLQGGAPGGYYHLSVVEYVGTGTGVFVRSTNPTISYTATLGNTFATNQPYQLVLGVAQYVTSLDVAPPFVDGLTLESGVAAAVVPVATESQLVYTTPLALPVGALYFLSQTGTLTSVVPTAAAGDVWLVIVARQIDSTHFVFTPTQPIAL